MNKKLYSIIIFIILMLSISITGLADTIITITRPDGDKETTFKETYVICGNTDLEDVTVELAVYSAADGKYIPLATIEDETSFKIGASGMFMKEVRLNIGANKIRVTAISGEDYENVQECVFSIIRMEESLKDKIKGGFLKFTEIINKVFENKDPK